MKNITEEQLKEVEREFEETSDRFSVACERKEEIESLVEEDLKVIVVLLTAGNSTIEELAESFGVSQEAIRFLTQPEV